MQHIWQHKKITACIALFIAVFLSKKAPVKRLNKIILESDKT